ncbi:BRCA1-A complex subunit RAP80 isoform X2 [Syngnathoides biaculeatus]|uniref:BRCA1-A complex subunit RAP80 isoform X2 n=1 Tax=Syngnathoides biaculeatus TaxID=300417 RepID=UPI002ADD8048|nr:BRCA1-A complex subunit RAP80 isoform X2 [Syngnathoides biaculeatus]
MPQRKQRNPDGPTKGQLLDQNAKKDEALNEGEEQDECSGMLLPPFPSDREKRGRGRKCKAKSKDMTEEEMMALALHLSAQEASVSMQQVQQEEAAVLKAIKNSMFGENQGPCQSQSLLTEADTSRSRRSQSYPKARPESADVCPSLGKEGKGQTNQDQMCRTKEAIAPDLLQSHDVCTQALPSSSKSPFQFLDSPQSSDSTQIDECPLHKSTNFPFSGRRAMFLPEDGASSARCKSPALSELDMGDDGADYLKSPVFGDETRHKRFSSQESLSPPLRPSSCPPVSPVFPRSPAPSKNLASSKKSTLSESVPVVSGAGDRLELLPRCVSDDSSETDLTSDTTPRWSDDDADETLVSSPSPVFAEEKARLNRVTKAGPETNGSSCNLNTQQCVPTQPTVHYYWGVPFCPRGLDADAYTKVIVTQLEVYEKSLKEAQRCLLRKAEWGDGILPQSEKSSLPDSSDTKRPCRRGLRGKYEKLLSRHVDSFPVEMEEEEEKEGEEKQEEEEKEKEGMEEEGIACKEGQQMNTDNYLICPETQMSGEDHGDLAQPNSPNCSERGQRGDDLDVEKRKDEEEMMEVSANGESQTNHLITANVGAKPSPTNEEEEGGSRSPKPDPPGPKAAVECPICQGTFPAGKIERHAAYCDGTAEPAVAEELLQVPSKRRRKRKRWAGDEEGHPSSPDNIQEKCYICQKAVALREYAAHTELCIQRRATKMHGKANLLAALENIESEHSRAGPSRCRLQQADVIDLRDDSEGEVAGGSMLGNSNSPIKSFIPISEATDCLVDFKRQQRLKKPNHKRR